MLSIFTTATKPLERGDMLHEAIECYSQLADEVIIVNGRPAILAGYESDEVRNYGLKKNIKVINQWWPREFSWEFIGQQFQRGYELCKGDWVIHMDLDFFFHEDDFHKIKRLLNNNPRELAFSFHKKQFILPDRYNVKSRLVLAVNKRLYKDEIRFDSGGDLCQPSFNGQKIEINQVPESGLPIWVYEKTCKTKDQIKDDVGRMARAWDRYFKEKKLGGPDDNSAYNEWYKMVSGRLRKSHEKVKLSDHPKFVQPTLKSLKPQQFGYSAFGLERNSYAEGD